MRPEASTKKCYWPGRAKGRFQACEVETTEGEGGMYENTVYIYRYTHTCIHISLAV